MTTRPEWLEPEAALAAWVPAEFVLARTDDLVVCIGGISAYRTGFTFVVTVVMREPVPDGAPPAWYLLYDGGSDPPPDAFLRLTLSFPDGRLARNWTPSGQAVAYPPLHSRPESPILMPSSGTGSSRRNDMAFWVWPLPGPGPVAFTCVWPAYGVPESRVELEGQLLTDAAARSIQLWPEEGPF